MQERLQEGSGRRVPVQVPGHAVRGQRAVHRLSYWTHLRLPGGDDGKPIPGWQVSARRLLPQEPLPSQGTDL